MILLRSLTVSRVMLERGGGSIPPIPLVSALCLYVYFEFDFVIR